MHDTFAGDSYCVARARSPSMRLANAFVQHVVSIRAAGSFLRNLRLFWQDPARDHRRMCFAADNSNAFALNNAANCSYRTAIPPHDSGEVNQPQEQQQHQQQTRTNQRATLQPCFRAPLLCYILRSLVVTCATFPENPSREPKDASRRHKRTLIRKTSPRTGSSFVVDEPARDDAQAQRR